MPDPVDGEVHGTEPGEFKDYIFSSTTHNIEEMFLGDLFNVYIKGASIIGYTSLVCSLVYISNSNRGGEFFHRKAVFSDKLPVDTGDVSTRVYQCGGVKDFEGV